MSLILEPSPVLRLCSVLTARPETLPEAEEALTARFGPVRLRSERFPFDHCDYYHAEMGEDLERTWLCFARLCRPDELVADRLTTGDIEDGLAADGRRRVNLDPGYLDHGQLVLASLKQGPGKIYLQRGVWAHPCLRYRHGGFTAPDHSFPDFRDGRVDGFMRRAKALYKGLLAARQDRP